MYRNYNNDFRSLRRRNKKLWFPWPNSRGGITLQLTRYELCICYRLKLIVQIRILAPLGPTQYLLGPARLHSSIKFKLRVCFRSRLLTDGQYLASLQSPIGLIFISMYICSSL
jgi:hypothetical protein